MYRLIYAALYVYTNKYCQLLFGLSYEEVSLYSPNRAYQFQKQ